MGRRGGLVVNVVSFYSDDSSLNPAELYSFSVKCCLRKLTNRDERWPNLKTDHKVGLFMARVVVERQQPKGISAITEIRLEAFNNEAQ